MFPFASTHLYDPLSLVLTGLGGVALLIYAPAALLVLFLTAVSTSGPARFSAADRARLVQQERRSQAARLARAVAAHDTTRHVVPQIRAPWTTAQHTRYADMRAKGWSELAARQAAERFGA